MAKLGQQEVSKEELDELIPKTNGYDHNLALQVSQQLDEQVEIPVPPRIVAPRPLPPVTPPIDYSQMIATISAWKDILNARLLALLSVLGTLGGFGFVMYDPTPLRLWGLGIYAVLCQAPILALYLRKG